MEKKNKLLTIGQFAALHGINKKTLMWYDEIGLFHPAAVHPENGYRYYSYYQSSILETILLLRELDVPIAEIRTFMKNRSAASMAQLLQEKIEELDRELTHLKAVRKTLSYHRQNMQTLLTMDLSKISMVQKEERRFVTVDIRWDTSFDQLVELITAETKKYQLRRLHDASYGTMIAVESLYQGNFEDYSKMFIEIPFPIKKSGLHTQPAGNYVRAFYKESAENALLCYRNIFDFAAEHSLVLSGYSYEIIINENVIERQEDALVQIEVPVKPKQHVSCKSLNDSAESTVDGYSDAPRFSS